LRPVSTVDVAEVIEGMKTIMWRMKDRERIWRKALPLHLSSAFEG
jgi:hypothetical protein